MMFPFGTDRDGRRPAIATIVLIFLNVAIYVAMQMDVGARWVDPTRGDGPVDAFIEHFWLNPQRFIWWQLFTSAFVHDPGGIGHLAMNMLFLWVFGKPVESHLGFWRFVVLYLAACAVSGLAQCAVSSVPSIGASGAVYGVMGLFVAFFPRSHTKLLYVFLGVGFLVMPSMWLVGIYVIIDVLRQAFDWGGIARSEVASMAHLGGAAFGVIVGIALLKLKVVPRGEWDLLYVVTQFVRRRRLRATLRGAEATPWMSGKASGAIATGGTLDASGQRQAELRSMAQTRLRERDPDGAIAHYRELVALAPNAALGHDAQLEIANRALALGDAELAVRAYRNYIGAHGGERSTDEVRLLLATVLARRLGRPGEARPLLVGLADRLRDATQRDLARSLDAECGGTAS